MTHGDGSLASHEPIRLIVADDHPLFLDGVVATLRARPDLAVIGVATDANGAVRLARQHRPDVAMLDVTMPGSGLAAAREIRAAVPSTRILMLTVSEDEDDLLEAMKAGAAGYVLKGVSGRELVSIVRSVHAGEVYVAPSLAWRLLGELTKPRPAGPFEDLTSRERQVLELVAAGLSNGEIGSRLNLAEKTVKHYMTNVLAKLQVRSRVEAALLAQRAGLGPPPESS